MLSEFYKARRTFILLGGIFFLVLVSLVVVQELFEKIYKSINETEGYAKEAAEKMSNLTSVPFPVVPYQIPAANLPAKKEEAAQEEAAQSSTRAHNPEADLGASNVRVMNETEVAKEAAGKMSNSASAPFPVVPSEIPAAEKFSGEITQEDKLTGALNFERTAPNVWNPMPDSSPSSENVDDLCSSSEDGSAFETPVTSPETEFLRMFLKSSMMQEFVERDNPDDEELQECLADLTTLQRIEEGDRPGFLKKDENGRLIPAKNLLEFMSEAVEVFEYPLYRFVLAEWNEEAKDAWIDAMEKSSEFAAFVFSSLTLEPENLKCMPSLALSIPKFFEHLGRSFQAPVLSMVHEYLDESYFLESSGNSTGEKVCSSFFLEVLNSDRLFTESDTYLSDHLISYLAEMSYVEQPPPVISIISALAYDFKKERPSLLARFRDIFEFLLPRFEGNEQAKNVVEILHLYANFDGSLIIETCSKDGLRGKCDILLDVLLENWEESVLEKYLRIPAQSEKDDEAPESSEKKRNEEGEEMPVGEKFQAKEKTNKARKGMESKRVQKTISKREKESKKGERRKTVKRAKKSQIIKKRIK